MGGGGMRMVSMGVQWHRHGTGADLGWPVEVDAGTHLGWRQHIEKGWGASKSVQVVGKLLKVFLSFQPAVDGDGGVCTVTLEEVCQHS